jgi:IS5 family transposase
MGPKTVATSGQDLFRMELVNLIDPRHELVKLAALIDWQAFSDEWSPQFVSTTGRPALRQHTGSGHAGHQRGGVQHTGPAAVSVAESFKSRCAPTEPRHRMAAPGVGEHDVSQVPGRNSSGHCPPAHNHHSSLSQMMYWSQRGKRAGDDV